MHSRVDLIPIQLPVSLLGSDTNAGTYALLVLSNDPLYTAESSGFTQIDA